MSAACPRCGSLLFEDSQECETCAQAQVTEAVTQAGTQAEPPPPNVDGFVELEASLKTLREARAFVDEQLGQLRASGLADPTQAKLLPVLIRGATSLGTSASKVSKELLVWQKERHKVAQNLSVEEEVAKVVKWFWKKLNVFQMRALLDQLLPLYNERRRAGDKRKPWAMEP